MQFRVGSPLYGGTFTRSAGAPLPLVLPAELAEEQDGELTVLEPSPARVSPGCIHFGRCGGCQYQHADYPAQLAFKREILAGLLHSLSAAPLPVGEPQAAEPWEYRNRIRLRVQAGAEGRLQLGYNERGSVQFLPVRMCPIAAPLLWRAAQALLLCAEQDADSARCLHAAAEVELFCDADESALQLQIFLREMPGGGLSEAQFARLGTLLKGKLPELAGAGLVMHPDAPRRARQAWSGIRFGAPGLRYRVADHAWWVSRGAFFQVNRFLLPGLLQFVTSGQSGRLAWDLYAGVGLFTQVLAGQFEQVVSVEGSPAASADLAQLARHLPGVQPRAEATLDFLRRAVTQRDRPDLVVVDPPRAGLGTEAAALLVQAGPERIVYVSCDPVTLARDLAVLLRAGYVAEVAMPFDLFPQTFHLETVVRLRRAGASVV